jgi:endoglucanase
MRSNCPRAAGIIAIPNRYMHNPVEMVSLPDLEHAAELLAHYFLVVTPSSDFTP